MVKVYIARFLFLFFYIFPIKYNKIFLSSFEGKKIACNPKYIYEEIKNEDYIFVWEYNFIDKKNTKKVKYVKHNSLKYIYHVMTSKIIITNSGLSPIFPLRRKQKVINTWHGSGAYKKVGKDIDPKINGTTEARQKLINRYTTYFISGCKSFTDVMSNAIGLDKRKFLEIGMPRNSILFKNNNIASLKQKLKLEKFDKLCLYAPTFRGSTDNVTNSSKQLDVEMLKKILTKKFGGNWSILYRGHYLDNNGNNQNMIDVSDYDDMQELLLVSDILITDYSSSIWDYSFLNRPCFLFCYDLEQYKSERDFYVPIEEWGFPIAQTNEELKNEILNFDFILFEQNMIKHHNELGSFESINSSRKICDLIKQL